MLLLSFFLLCVKQLNQKNQNSTLDILLVFHSLVVFFFFFKLYFCWDVVLFLWGICFFLWCVPEEHPPPADTMVLCLLLLPSAQQLNSAQLLQVKEENLDSWLGCTKKWAEWVYSFCYWEQCKQVPVKELVTCLVAPLTFTHTFKIGLSSA